MKIGRSTRHGGPSKEFLERKGLAKAALDEAAARRVPDEGPVHLYLDDTRPTPAGWTLVRSPGELWELLGGDRDVTSRVEALSLDYDLGVGITNGQMVAERLAERFRDDPSYLPRLRVLGLHSQNQDKALEMIRTLRKAIGRERWYDIIAGLGTPSL